MICRLQHASVKRKNIRNNSPETKRSKKGLEASIVKGKNLCNLMTAQKLTNFLGEYMYAMCFNTTLTTWIREKEPTKRWSFSDKTNWRKGLKYHQKYRIMKLGDRGQSKSWSRASCPGDVLAREAANECKDYRKSLSSLKEKKPWSVSCFLEQNRLKRSQDPLSAFVQCSLSGIKRVKFKFRSVQGESC